MRAHGTVGVGARPCGRGAPALPLRAVGAGAAAAGAHRRRCAAPTLAPAGGAPVLRRTLVKTATIDAPLAVEAPPVVEARLEEAAPQQFNWFKAWYPVATLDSLKPERPNEIRLLGLNLVAWRPPNGDGSWSVLEDACPHRLAPLSEGRIHSDGNLMCSYHGWTFDGEGACKSIPQLAGDPKAHATACSSGRSCVKKYPSQARAGILWVWAEPGPAAFAEAAAAGPPAVLPADIANGEWEPKEDWFMRDVPVNYDTLVENVMDPSHVQFSHHGVIGNRNAPAHMLASIEGPITPAGFDVTYTGEGARTPRVEFRAPSLSKWCFHPKVHMILWAVPTRPGWTRVFQAMTGPKDSSMVMPPNAMIPPIGRFFMRVMRLFPWMAHALQTNAILDGDDYFLHKTERYLYARGDSSSWSKQYYMPSSADAGVIGWRRWLDTYGSGLPVLPKGADDLPPTFSKRDMFDRYEQHTKHCSHCSAALRNFTIAVGVLAAAAAAAAGAAIAAVATGAAPLTSAFVGRAAGASVVAALAAVALYRFRELFVYHEYDHNERH